MKMTIDGKIVFLLGSMAGWLLVGGALIYLAPVLANLVFHSDTTELWMATLRRGGYNPVPAVIGGAVVLVTTVASHVKWSGTFGQTR